MELYKVKKICVIMIVAILGCLSLTACAENDKKNSIDFIADDIHCVVSLPQEYDIVYINDELSDLSMFDKDLHNADTVNGAKKKAELRYYYLPKNEPFRIITPLGIIQNKNASGQTLVYWKLNDTLYKDGDTYYSANDFTCNQDTEITPVYYEFRAVGMLLYEVDENHIPTAPNGEFFDNAGNIKEQSGVHYLYGVYDFEPYREFWRTDLTLKKFATNITSVMAAENYYKNIYKLDIEIESGNIFKNGDITVETLCKIDGHGYMTYGNKSLIGDIKNTTHYLSIGEHEIQYSFV